MNRAGVTSMKKVFKNGKLWCSLPDAAEHLHTTQETISEYVACGRLSSTHLKRAEVLYVSVTDLAELQDWIRSLETVRPSVTADGSHRGEES